MTEVVQGSRIVTFRLGAELFAADIFAVERVLKYDVPRTIPNLPEWIEGVIEYQGRVVPVVDLRRRFALPIADVGAQTRLLICASAREWIAVVVDAVLDVRPVMEAELAAPPPLFRGLAAEYLQGIVRRGDDLVVVLDFDRLLASHERISLDPLTRRSTSHG